MDKQKEGDKKSNIKYQKLKDDSPPPSSSPRSIQNWFEKKIQRDTGPKYERLKEEEDEKQSYNKKDQKK